jgi:hypothetical protein
MNKFLLCVVLLFCMPLIIYPQTINQNSGYEYPIKPGTAEWKSIESRYKLVEACQIPNEILRKLSTKQLLATCLNYPFLPEIFAYDNMQEGFDNVSASFNGWQELLKRSDNINVLIDKYTNCNPNLVKNYSSDYDIGKFRMNILFVELILAQDAILIKSNDQLIVSLLRESIKKYDQKLALGNSYDILSFTSGAYLTGNIINKIDTSVTLKSIQESSVDSFIKTSKLSNIEDLDYIYYKGKQILTNKN